jgi:hypothetical protein
MLNLVTGEENRGLTRRTVLRIGAIGLGGLTLPDVLRLRRVAGAAGPRGPGASSSGKARSVILLFLSGGPSQLDMWDPKPEAPEEIQGTFAPIETSLPDVRIAEHLPRMARLADKYAILRSVRHTMADHPAAAYWMMVGSPIQRPACDASFMSRADRPHPGSIVAKILGTPPALPAFVMLPEAMAPNGPERAGQHAGFLGGAFDPYRINSDPNRPNYSPGVLAPVPEISLRRLNVRRALFNALGRHVAYLEGTVLSQEMDADYARAFDLLSSPAAQRAFDITAEPDATRNRYGRHVFGQSVLLARRMVEAGVRLVHVNWVRHDQGKGGQGYDTHRDHLDWARTELLPPTDAAFAALIEDLDGRGFLDETLVIMMGEFGRTPRFNNAGGRDHWPHCFSVVMAGGGIRGGQVLGASDRIAAYPASEPVSPENLIATLYHCLGIDPRTIIHDQQDRPFPLVGDEPLHALL